MGSSLSSESLAFKTLPLESQAHNFSLHSRFCIVFSSIQMEPSLRWGVFSVSLEGKIHKGDFAFLENCYHFPWISPPWKSICGTSIHTVSHSAWSLEAKDLLSVLGFHFAWTPHWAGMPWKQRALLGVFLLVGRKLFNSNLTNDVFP